MNSRHWLIATAAVVALGASGRPIWADATPMAPAASSMSSTASAPLDYSIIDNGTFTYWDLYLAHFQAHLDIDTTAAILKFAELTGQPFSAVYAAVERGETFEEMAAYYNIDVDDLYDNAAQVQEINEFYAVWNTTGENAEASSGEWAGWADWSAGFAKWQALEAAIPDIPQRPVLTFAPNPEPPAPVQPAPEPAPTPIVEPTPPPAPQPAVMPEPVVHHGHWVCSCQQHHYVHHYRPTRHVRHYTKYVHHKQPCHCHWVQS